VYITDVLVRFPAETIGGEPNDETSGGRTGLTPHGSKANFRGTSVWPWLPEGNWSSYRRRAQTCTRKGGSSKRGINPPAGGRRRGREVSTQASERHLPRKPRYGPSSNRAGVSYAVQTSSVARLARKLKGSSKRRGKFVAVQRKCLGGVNWGSQTAFFCWGKTARE